MAANKNFATATIAISTSLSAAISVGGGTVCGIQMPAAWTAAAITFQVSVDGVTFQDMFVKAGTEYSVTAAVSTYIALPSADFEGIQWLKVRSGTSGSPVTQAAARAVVVVSVKARDSR